MRTVLLGVLVISVVNCSHGSFTSRRRLHQLLTLETTYTRQLSTVYNGGFSFLQNFTRQFIKTASARSATISKDDYVSNPLLALVMIRRLVEEWTSLSLMARKNQGLSEVDIEDVQWPTTEDLISAAMTVFRAQYTYGLDTDMLASGKFTGNRVLSNVTAADCFYIGFAYWKHSFVDEAVEWFKQAIYKVDVGDSSVTKETLLQHFVPLTCASGGNRKSHITLTELLGTYPGLKFDKNEYLRQLYVEMGSMDCSEIFNIVEENKNVNMYQGVDKEDLEHHKKLCQGEEIFPTNVRCRFVHYDQPHLRFQPFKVEELHRNPPVLRFYDCITDSEAESLKAFAMQEMERANIVNPDGTPSAAIYRTSQTGWIFPGDLAENDRLSRRIEDMTQLNEETAEATQLSRYSISGEYLPHFDYLKYSGTPFEHDRIATLMFYLNDVPQGGNTVFLHWNLTVKPVRNTAILWFNHLPSGETDPGSYHSGCPVLQGTKWVANKWFQNEGHEFTKHCGLSQFDSFSPYYIK